MEWQIVVALVVAVVVMLLPGTLVWYLNDERVRDMMRLILPSGRRKSEPSGAETNRDPGRGISPTDTR